MTGTKKMETGKQGMLTKLMMFLSGAALFMMFVLMGRAQNVEAAQDPYYLSIPKDLYSVTQEDGIITVSTKTGAAMSVAFQIGSYHYYETTPFSPYLDLKVEEKEDQYVMELPFLKQTEEGAQDYFVQIKDMSQYTTFQVLYETDKWGSYYYKQCTDEDSVKEFEISSYYFVDGNSEIKLSLIYMGNPQDYLCTLNFQDYSMGFFGGDSTSYTWTLYGEEYEVEINSQVEDINDTLWQNEVNLDRCFLGAEDLSSYYVKLIQGSRPSDVRLVIDGVPYEFDAIHQINLSPFADHKMHSVSMEAVYPDISACKVKAPKKLYYTGKQLKPAVKVVDASGRVLKKGVDYTLSYEHNKKIGKAEILIFGKGDYKGILRGSFKIVEPKEGKSFVASGIRYVVTNELKNEVSVLGTVKKKVSKVEIPDMVGLSKYEYKYLVTGIADDAFLECKKLHEVTIGMNVVKIGKRAFYGDSGLKRLNVETLVLQKVGEDAFEGVPSNLKMDLPSSKKEAYDKLFQQGGLARNH